MIMILIKIVIGIKIMMRRTGIRIRMMIFYCKMNYLRMVKIIIINAVVDFIQIDYFFQKSSLCVYLVMILFRKITKKRKNMFKQQAIPNTNQSQRIQVKYCHYHSYYFPNRITSYCVQPFVILAFH